jgi:hypothetical protein
MSIIVEPLRLLQSNSITSIEVHSIMVQLKSKFQTRLNEAHQKQNYKKRKVDKI